MNTLFASMSDAQFGILMFSVTVITIAAFYFGRRVGVHTPVIDIDAGQEPPKSETQPKAPRRKTRKKGTKRSGKEQRPQNELSPAPEEAD